MLYAPFNAVAKWIAFSLSFVEMTLALSKMMSYTLKSEPRLLREYALTQVLGSIVFENVSVIGELLLTRLLNNNTLLLKLCQHTSDS